MHLSSLITYCNQLLAVDPTAADHGYNGLQVEGGAQIKRVAFAVDPCMVTFERAAQEGAQLLITHHSLFWRGMNPALVGWMRERVDLLRKHDLSLYVAHLPLDRHPELGNNAQLLQVLGARPEKPFEFYGGNNIGWTGTCAKPLALQTVEALLNEKLQTTCITLPFGPQEIRTVAVCSGGGSYTTFNNALAAGVDLYLTGDRIDVYRTAQDARMNVIMAGHYATETLGLKALAEHLRVTQPVEVVFIDAPTQM